MKLPDKISFFVTDYGSGSVLEGMKEYEFKETGYVTYVPASRVERLEARVKELEIASDMLAKVLRAHDRWQMDYGGEGYYDGCMQSSLSEDTEIALGMHANLNKTPPTNEALGSGGEGK